MKPSYDYEDAPSGRTWLCCCGSLNLFFGCSRRPASSDRHPRKRCNNGSLRFCFVASGKLRVVERTPRIVHAYPALSAHPISRSPLALSMPTPGAARTTDMALPLVRRTAEHRPRTPDTVPNPCRPTQPLLLVCGLSSVLAARHSTTSRALTPAVCCPFHAAVSPLSSCHSTTSKSVSLWSSVCVYVCMYVRMYVILYVRPYVCVYV